MIKHASLAEEGVTSYLYHKVHCQYTMNLLVGSDASAEPLGRTVRHRMELSECRELEESRGKPFCGNMRQTGLGPAT